MCDTPFGLCANQYIESGAIPFSTYVLSLLAFAAISALLGCIYHVKAWTYDSAMLSFTKLNPITESIDSQSVLYEIKTPVVFPI